AKSDRAAAKSDRAAAKQLKKTLDNDPTFKYPNVSTTVHQGTVQLTGFVETEEERLRASQIAASVEGVNQVINQVTIKPNPTGRATIQDPLRTNAPPLPPMPSQFH